jgi:nitroimidazol reductase NimA-like FMN-containing flavoprotein (pyridoxamine 5'-phosphate oxidase superfamily)
MRRKEKEIKKNSKLIEILKNGKYIIISMCRRNEPYIVTLSYGYDSSKNSLYFHCATEGLKLEIIKENPNVCATIIEDKGYIMHECNHKYRSLVLRGKMKIITDISEKQHGFDVLLHHLEENPEKLKSSLFKTNKPYESTCIMRMDILSIQGKEGA